MQYGSFFTQDSNLALFLLVSFELNQLFIKITAIKLVEPEKLAEKLSTGIFYLLCNLPIHDLIAKHLRTKEVFVVDVAEEAEAEVAGVAFSELGQRIIAAAQKGQTVSQLLKKWSSFFELVSVKQRPEWHGRDGRLVSGDAAIGQTVAADRIC